MEKSISFELRGNFISEEHRKALFVIAEHLSLSKIVAFSNKGTFRFDAHLYFKKGILNPHKLFDDIYEVCFESKMMDVRLDHSTLDEILLVGMDALEYEFVRV